MEEQAPYRRRSARVLLVDGAGRILLLRFLTESTDQGYCWLTPGGGVNHDESLPEAAARELLEEVGLAVTPQALGQPVAHSAGYANFGWASGIFRDDFFYHRVDAHDVDTGRMETLERTHHGGHRWWSLDELTSATDPVYPLGLARLLADLLAGDIPRQPVPLPWHH